MGLVERLVRAGRGEVAIERIVARAIREAGLGPRDVPDAVRRSGLSRGGPVGLAQKIARQIDRWARNPHMPGDGDDGPLPDLPRSAWMTPDSPWFHRLHRTHAAASTGLGAFREALAPRPAPPVPTTRLAFQHAGPTFIPREWRALPPTAAPGIYALQRRSDHGLPAADRPTPERILAELGAGRPLPRALATRLRKALAAAGAEVDLDAIRIHDDAAADHVCRQLRASAFALGSTSPFAPAASGPSPQPAKRYCFTS